MATDGNGDWTSGMTDTIPKQNKFGNMLEAALDHEEFRVIPKQDGYNISDPASSCFQRALI